MTSEGINSSAGQGLQNQNNSNSPQTISLPTGNAATHTQMSLNAEQRNGFRQNFGQAQSFSPKISQIASKQNSPLRQLQQYQVNQGIKRKNLSPQPVSIDLVHQGDQKKTKLDMNKYLQVQQNALHMSRLQAAQAQSQAQNQNSMGVMNNVVVSMPMNLGGLNINQPFQQMIGNPFLNLYGLQAIQQQTQNQITKQEGISGDRNSAIVTQQQQQQQARKMLQGTTTDKQMRNHAGPNNTDGDSKKQKVSEALHYLAEVKKKFKGNVKVYCLFLEIMKKFKSNQVDTPGVLKEVINLFSRQEELITGFNKFLPAGFTVQIGKFENSPPRCVRVFLPTSEYITLDLDRLQFDEFDEKMKKVNARISADILYYNANANAAKKHRNTESKFNNADELTRSVSNAGAIIGNPKFNNGVDLTNLNHLGGGVASLQAISQGNNINIGFPVGLPGLTQLNPGLTPGAIQGLQGAANSGIGYLDNNTPKNKQRVSGKSEFSEAIHYVSKIKRRFAHDSAAYRSFLDILHIYQKDQGTIKKVLQKVAKLFEGHNDLLKEFCFFLPDESRNKAKKIVDDILRRKDAENGIDKVDKYEDKYGERMLWQRLKEKFRNSKLYAQFLGVLELFMKACITKREFLDLTSNLMHKASNPVEEIKDQDLDKSSEALLGLLDSFLCSNNIVDSPVLSAFFSLPRTDMDFGDSFRPTPSYRQLPDAYLRYSDPRLEEKGKQKVRYKLNACSGRTKLCDAVLNDRYVSVSTGSEDDFSFKHFRKNIYEEALFRCEDERHAFDMVLEWNRRAIQHLSKLQKEVNKYSSTANLVKTESAADEKETCSAIKFRLGKNSLTILHIKAIARAYGSYANEILELLRLTPHIAIPVVLSRLKEQDILLTQRKEHLNIEWRRIHEQNFNKSLDHRSFYFKQTDKKEVGTKSLLAQIKAVYKQNTADLKGHKSEFVRFLFKDSISEQPESASGSPGHQFHVELYFDDVSVHKSCFSIILFMLRRVEVSSKSSARNHHQQNSTKMLAFIVNILLPFVGLKLADFEPKDGDTTQVDAFLSKKAKELLKVAYLKQNSGVDKLEAEKNLDLDQLNEDLSLLKCEEDFFGNGAVTLFGSSSLFLFFRLYNILYERILRAKYASEDAALKQSESENSKDPYLTASARFETVMDGLHSLVAGDMDSSAFEDLCRTVLRSGSYVLFTLEKILSLLDKHIENGILSLEKFKSLFKKLNDFAALKCEDKDISCITRTDKLVSVYRQCYQTVMNQVDGLCYEIVMLPGEKEDNNEATVTDTKWKQKPTIKASLTKSFPTVHVHMEEDAERIIDDPFFLIPLEANFKRAEFNCHWGMDNKLSYRGNLPLLDRSSPPESNFFLFPMLRPVKLSLDTAQLDDIGIIARVFANKRRAEYNDGKYTFGAKNQWWFFGNYEECRSEKQNQSVNTNGVNSEQIVESNNVGKEDSKVMNVEEE